MAHFTRTRKPGLDVLDSNPQVNLEAVYRILLAGIELMELNLIKVQKLYYGRGHDALDELTMWIRQLRPVMSVIESTNLASADHIDETIRRQLNNAALSADDIAAVQKLQEAYRKTRDWVPGKMEHILASCKDILRNLGKYCASFYVPGQDPPLETANLYEGQRQKYISTIGGNIGHVYDMINRFQTNNGLRLHADFGPYSLDLARRGGCANIPFLLIFPEAVDNVRMALTTMKSWLADDARYAGYMENDARDLIKKTEASEKEIRDLKSQYHRDLFRTKQAEEEGRKLKNVLEKLQNREDQLMVEEEMLAMETSEMSTELDTAEHRRKGLTKMHLANPKNDVTLEQLTKVTENLNDLKSRLPIAEQRLVVVRGKLKAIEEKKLEFLEKQQQVKSLETETETVAKQIAETEVEHDVDAHALEIVRKIILYKRSADVVRKVFFDQPIQPSSSRLPGSKDQFDKTCHLVAKRIENDWPALYRSLPFQPPRGQRTVDQDIGELTLFESRHGVEKAAEKAIDRWRRFHTRAKLEDLFIALSGIQRPEILTQSKINSSTKSMKDLSVQTEIPEWLSPDLIPFWREVERFDQLRTSNKIR